MNEKVKLVVLGGSGVATPGLIEALTGIPGRRTPVELVLVGRSEEKLALVSGVSLIVAGDDPLISIHHTTQVEEALNGCSYVLNQVRVGGLAARVYDESFPNELGIPGEETVGAGGFANASRTIPVVLEYARMIERICPQATLLSFSNPSSLVQNAVTRYTTVKTIGLCDAPITLGQNIARALDVPFGQLSIDYLGMHHFGWVNGVWQKDRDLLPQTLEKAAMINPAIEASLIQSSGVIPGSYLKYIYHADRMLSQKTGKTTRAEELLVMQDELLEDYRVAIQTGQKPTTFNRRNAVWYKWVIAPLLVDLLEGSRRDENNLPPWRPSRHILNITNQNTISWMPENAIVEVPVLVENGHLRPLATRPLPVEERVLLQMNYAYERLAVEAIVLHNQDKAIRALCLNPLVHSYDQAKAVLKKAWDKEFK